MIENRVALVTGGGTGIGRAIAVELAKNGASVAIASRNAQRIQDTAEELRGRSLSAIGLAMDVRSKASVEAAVNQVTERYGSLHIVVNNAGISGYSAINDDSDDTWNRIIDTNLNGLYLTTKVALRAIPPHAGGRIINISSVLGKFGVAGYTAYCTTKHGMIGFTRALALELVDRGITVNTICPGWVDTDMATQGINETAAQQGITPAEFRAQAVAAIPIKRFVYAEEVAAMVSYLASDRAAGITGQAINVCGGQTMF